MLWVLPDSSHLSMNDDVAIIWQRFSIPNAFCQAWRSLSACLDAPQNNFTKHAQASSVDPVCSTFESSWPTTYNIFVMKPCRMQQCPIVQRMIGRKDDSSTSNCLFDLVDKNPCFQSKLLQGWFSSSIALMITPHNWLVVHNNTQASACLAISISKRKVWGLQVWAQSNFSMLGVHDETNKLCNHVL